MAIETFSISLKYMAAIKCNRAVDSPNGSPWKYLKSYTIYSLNKKIVEVILECMEILIAWAMVVTCKHAKKKVP